MIRKLFFAVMAAALLPAVGASQNYYAVLITGDTPNLEAKSPKNWNAGRGSEGGFDEFWNDTFLMWELLRDGGFDEHQIYVLYGNGEDYFSENPRYQPPPLVQVTDFQARIVDVQNIFTWLAYGNPTLGIPALTDQDVLFIYTFDHGNRIGNHSTLCLMDGEMLDYVFAGYVNQIHCQKRIIWMQQCFSGGFIDDLQSSKTMILTACEDDEVAYRADDINPDGGDPLENEWYNGQVYHHGEFNYHVMNAARTKTIFGNPVPTDTNEDGGVSIAETKDWEFLRDSYYSRGWYHPQYSDPGTLGQASFIHRLMDLANMNKSLDGSATWSNSARHLLKGGGKLHEQFTSGGEIFYRRSSNNGTSWELTKRISSGNGSNNGGCLAVAHASSLHLVWQRQIATDRYEVWYSRSTDNGSSWTNPEVLPNAWEVKVSEYQTGGSMPVIAEGKFDRGNKLFVVFCSGEGLRYRVSEDDGATWHVPDDEFISGQYNDRVRSPSLAGGRDFFSLTYDYAEVVNGLWSRIHDGSQWSDEKDVQDGTGLVLGAHPSVAIDADNQPVAAWSAITPGLDTRRILFRQGGSDNSWSKWFVEFGEGGNLIDWHYPSLTYYNRDGSGAYGVGIVNHTSTNAVKLIKYIGDELYPPWSIETVGESGAWANISVESYSSGTPAYLWTDQSGSPYQIVLGSDGLSKFTANELSHSRRAVVRHKPTNASLSLEVSQMAVVTAAGDTLPLPFKLRPLRDSTDITLSNVWEYLGTAVSTLPQNARWLVVTKNLAVRGPSVIPPRYSLRVLGSDGIQLAVLDTNSVSGTTRINVSAFAGRNIVIRPSLSLAGIPPSVLTLGAGDVFLLHQSETKSTLQKSQQAAAQISSAENYPNPFNPLTTISYTIPTDEHVSLKVYDVLGREIAALVDAFRKAGSYTATFDASRFASGVYLYVLRAGSHTQVRKMVFVK
jgi:hypothetical protein